MEVWRCGWGRRIGDGIGVWILGTLTTFSGEWTNAEKGIAMLADVLVKKIRASKGVLLWPGKKWISSQRVLYTNPIPSIQFNR